MKKIWLVITLLHLSVLGMENEQFKFDLAQFLKENKWHERKDALTVDQREEFCEYIEEMQKERKSTNLADVDLASILMYGLWRVEREKTFGEANELLYRAIMDDCPKKVRRAIGCGARPGNPYISGRTPIFWAVKLNKDRALEALVENMHE